MRFLKLSFLRDVCLEMLGYFFFPHKKENFLKDSVVLADFLVVSESFEDSQQLRLHCSFNLLLNLTNICILLL